MKTLVFVLWAMGMTGPMGQDKSPRDYWHPVQTYTTAKACHDFANSNPKYAKRMICLRMRYERAFSAVSQKDQPR